MEIVDNVIMEKSRVSSRDAQVKKEIFSDSTRERSLENGDKKIALSQVVQEVGEVKKLVTRSDPRTSSRTQSVSSADPSLLENMRIYVRVKPFPKGVKLTKEQQLLYRVDKSSLFINLSDVKQDMTKNVDVVGKHFVFSEAFGGDVNQSKVYERVVEPQVDKLFAGKNCTVMTYGATGSGKSHTLDGSHTNPGLIPKILEDIFSLGKPKSTPKFRPKANGIECLDSAESLSELESTNQLLSSLPRKDPYVHMKVVQTPLQEEYDPSHFNGPPNHEVWISFVELRDEIYYDLLSHDYQTNHSPVKIFTDDKGKAFIKDLRHVSVTSAAEAKDILTIGRINLMRLYSMLSHEISKSHCIFTITLLKYQDVNQPESVQMSRFSFCDLAAHKSPEIDTSLLSLTQCLKYTKENHHHDSVSKHTEYFCHSKLTHLFEDALTGRENFSLIVNVDPNPGIYRETQAVLHSTAITSEILTKIRHPNNPIITTNFGQIAVKSALNINDWDDLQGDKIMQLSADFNMDIAKLKILNLRSDFQIRETMVKRYTSMIERIDKSYKRRLSLISPVVKIKKKSDNSEEVETNSMVDTPESEDIAALKTMLDTLRTRKQMVERDLKAVENKLNGIPPELYETCDAFENNKDPALKIFDMEMELKMRMDKKDELNKLLNDAREEILRLSNESIEDKKKIGDIERKYVALKFDRDNEFVLHKSSKYAYARLLKIMGDMEMMKDMEIMRQVELCKGMEMELRKEMVLRKEKEMELLKEMEIRKAMELREEKKMKLCKVAEFREGVKLREGQKMKFVEREGEFHKEMELCKENEKEMELNEEVELHGEVELRKEMEFSKEKEMRLLEDGELCEEQEMKFLQADDIELHEQEMELDDEEMELDNDEMELVKEKEKSTESLENVSTPVNSEEEEELIEMEKTDVLTKNVSTTDPEVPPVEISDSEIVLPTSLNPSQTIPETPVTLPDTVDIFTTETIETPEIQVIPAPPIPVITVSDVETITLADESFNVPSVPENPVFPTSEISTPVFTTGIGACPGLRFSALEAKIFAHLETQIIVPETEVSSHPEAPITLAKSQMRLPVAKPMTSHPEIIEILEPEGSPIQSDGPPFIERNSAPIDLIEAPGDVPNEVENELNPSDEITEPKKKITIEISSPATSSSTYISCKSNDSSLTEDLSKSEPSDESPSTSESGRTPLRRSGRKRQAATIISLLQSSVKRAKAKDEVPIVICCDVCESVIHNQERYHCTVCEDYDLCLGCYSKVVHNHELEILPTPP